MHGHMKEFQQICIVYVNPIIMQNVNLFVIIFKD